VLNLSVDRSNPSLAKGKLSGLPRIPRNQLSNPLTHTPIQRVRAGLYQLNRGWPGPTPKKVGRLILKARPPQLFQQFLLIVLGHVVVGHHKCTVQKPIASYGNDLQGSKERDEDCQPPVD